jgi:hypothetical protein
LAEKDAFPLIDLMGSEFVYDGRRNAVDGSVPPVPAGDIARERPAIVADGPPHFLSNEWLTTVDQAIKS